MNGLVTALRFLTIIPVPGKESEKISSSLPWFPVAGFVIGFIMYLIPAAFSFMHLPEWSAGISLMTVAAGIIITG
jgi:adenosylcobinamide-GDP ribazoletransferase